MIYIFEAGLDSVYMIGDVNKLDIKAGAGIFLHSGDIIRLKACVQDYDLIGIVFGGVGDQRCDGNIQIGDVIIIRRKENGDLVLCNDLFHDFLTLPSKT